jgi:hypothetical protein
MSEWRLVEGVRLESDSRWGYIRDYEWVGHSGASYPVMEVGRWSNLNPSSREFLWDSPFPSTAKKITHLSPISD